MNLILKGYRDTPTGILYYPNYKFIKKQEIKFSSVILNEQYTKKGKTKSQGKNTNQGKNTTQGKKSTQSKYKKGYQRM